jgi:transcription elongation GreA/GreB family factor
LPVLEEIQNMQEIKTNLYQQCVDYVEQRIATSKKAMDAAQEAANSESKSSAGDKHETGRAMAQLEQEKSAKQLAEAIKLKKVLALINPEKTGSDIQLGSVVETSNGNFFIAISAGKLTAHDKNYFAISLASPIGANLKGLKAGDEMKFNGNLFKIEAVA